MSNKLLLYPRDKISTEYQLQFQEGMKLLHWHKSVKEWQINQVDCRGLSLEGITRIHTDSFESEDYRWSLWHFSSTDDFLPDILTLPLNKDKLLVSGWEAHGEPDHDFIMSKLEK